MKGFPDILNTAIAEMQKGSSTIEEIVSRYPKHAEELRLALHVTSTLSSVPTTAVPEPFMRRKFLQEPIKHGIFSSWLHISRFAAASMASLLLMATAAGTAYGAVRSLPGQPLFQLKRAAEQIHVSLISNPVAKANLQLAIAQRRVDDAEQVISNPSKTPEQESDALNELSSQTKQTIDSVKSAAASSPIAQKDHPVIASLEGLAKQQQHLIDQVAGQDSVKDAANTAVASNQEVKTFLLVVAASSDPAAIVSLSTDPNSISASGTIESISKDKLTIGKNSYSLTEKTIVKNASGNTVDITKISHGDKVIVTGIKNKNAIVVNQILDLSGAIASDPEVKGTSTLASTATENGKNASSTPTTSSLSLKKPEYPHKIIVPTSTEDSESVSDQTKTVGSFIPEDPSPQYVPGP